MNEQIGNKKEGKLSLKWLYLAWLSVIFTTLVISAIGVAAQGDPKPVILGWGISDFAIFAIALHAIGMIIAVVILLKRKQLGLDAVGLKGKISLSATGYVLAGVVIAFLLYPLVETALGTVGIGMYWEARATHLYLKSALDVILSLVGAVLIVPVTEEIIFRGYILTMFIEKKYKTVVAVLLSALIFTSTHIFFRIRYAGLHFLVGIYSCVFVLEIQKFVLGYIISFSQ